MPELTMTLIPDGAPLLGAIHELVAAAEALEIPQAALDRLLKLCEPSAELIRIKVEPLPAAGTARLLIRFYPSDRLLRLGFALRTRDFEFGIVEQHGGTSGGEGGERGQPAILPQASPSS